MRSAAGLSTPSIHIKPISGRSTGCVPCLSNLQGWVGQRASNFLVRNTKMDVREIVAEWLTEQGYDGLYDPGGCGCLLDDLMPCKYPSAQCRAGYKTACPGGDECEWGGKCGFHVGPVKKE